MALSWLKPEQLDQALLSRIEAGRPFSLLRFGDGEFEVCKYVAGGSHNDVEFIDKFRRWFGKERVARLKHTELVGLAVRILEAFKHCTFLGIPSFREAYGYPKWRGVDKFVNKHLPNGITFYFYDVMKLWRGSTFKDMLGNREHIDLITCRPRLAEKLKARFRGLKDVRMELIQAEHFMWKNHSGLQRLVDAWEGAPHYPHRFDEICASLRDQAPLTGRVFLVGAGGLGKIYCEVVRECGGIGIDVGALLDGWDGLVTRPYLEPIQEYAL